MDDGLVGEVEYSGTSRHTQRLGIGLSPGRSTAIGCVRTRFPISGAEWRLSALKPLECPPTIETH